MAGRYLNIIKCNYLDYKISMLSKTSFGGFFNIKNAYTKFFLIFNGYSTQVNINLIKW